MNGGLGKEVEDLLKDAIDLFIPEIICMAWQPQHHPLSTSAKSQAPASRVWKLWEIMLLITSKNGRKEEGRDGGMKRKTAERWGGGERRRRESRMIEGRGGAEKQKDRVELWRSTKETDHKSAGETKEVKHQAERRCVRATMWFLWGEPERPGPEVEIWKAVFKAQRLFTWTRGLGNRLYPRERIFRTPSLFAPRGFQRSMNNFEFWCILLSCNVFLDDCGNDGTLLYYQVSCFGTFCEDVSFYRDGIILFSRSYLINNMRCG